MADLRWLFTSGMADAIDNLRRRGCVIFGVCGGYQMLGREISDPDRTEEGGRARGLGFLDTETVFSKEKRRARVHGRITDLPGTLQPLGGMEIEGYEIHMGRSHADSSRTAGFCRIQDHRSGMETPDGTAVGNIYGTYVHGVFDAPGIARRIVEILAEHKGVTLKSSPGNTACAAPETDYQTYKETQYDLLADTLRRHLDMKHIYEILEES